MGHVKISIFVLRVVPWNVPELCSGCSRLCHESCYSRRTSKAFDPDMLTARLIIHTPSSERLVSDRCLSCPRDVNLLTCLFERKVAFPCATTQVCITSNPKYRLRTLRGGALSAGIWCAVSF
eukprot:Gregarina_sp_Pseudo_9__1000@NODE_1643_length_1429_cov_80_601439_g1523_i0_p1_GENE_NODE_1643_length_1429_cov_80_601439_g1523_i0NODE_1643_length_1429_cov_80_601439_g1523_i0_p1_ORF_typecomplete_len122_score7_25PHD_2/PF13831_6/0_021_NODE_1643_length_1429_cov_80_601439_g1523_i0515880